MSVLIIGAPADHKRWLMTRCWFVRSFVSPQSHHTIGLIYSFWDVELLQKCSTSKHYRISGLASKIYKAVSFDVTLHERMTTGKIFSTFSSIRSDKFF